MIRGAAVLGMVIAEALAVYVFAEWFAAGYEIDRQTVGWWSFVGVALVAFAVPRITDWLALSARASYLAVVGTAFVLIYGIVRLVYAGDVAIWDFTWVHDFVADSDTATGKGSHAAISTFLLVGLWARQAARSAFDVDLEMTPRAVAPGFGFVTIIAILGAITDRSGEIGRGAAAFYGVAIVALACSQLALSGATLPDVQAGGITAVLLGGTVAATLVLLLVLGALFAVLGPILGPPLNATLEAVLTVILTPFAIVLAWFFDLIFPDEGLRLPVRDLGRPPGQDDSPGEKDEGWSITDLSAAGFRSLVVLGLILGTAGAIMYFARLRKRVQESEDVGPARTAVGSLRDDLGSLWHSISPRRGHAGSSSGAGVARLYREVLERAERSGHPRRPSETASEFAPVLQDTFHRPVTDEITEAFEQARYAGREPDDATLAALERRWRENAQF